MSTRNFLIKDDNILSIIDNSLTVGFAVGDRDGGNVGGCVGRSYNSIEQ